MTSVRQAARTAVSKKQRNYFAHCLFELSQGRGKFEEIHRCLNCWRRPIHMIENVKTAVRNMGVDIFTVCVTSFA